MNRRATDAARAVAASLRRPRAAERREPAPSGLSSCVLCHRDYVAPVEWEPVGSDRWWMFLRCAECGTSREVTVSNAVAERYDEELVEGAREISRAAQRLEAERMAADVEKFVAALRHGVVEAADFAR